MGGMQVILEVVLLGLLAATLFHALRLERALGVLKRDRAVLEELVAGFNESTRSAENGIERLREAADGAGRQMSRQVETANALREDLRFLSERGVQVADRLDTLVRNGRAATGPAGAGTELTLPAGSEPETRVRSKAERDLLRALKLAR